LKENKLTKRLNQQITVLMENGMIFNALAQEINGAVVIRR